MEKPTQLELDVALDVIEWYINYLKENEPHAVNTINIIEEALGSIPYEISDLEAPQ